MLLKTIAYSATQPNTGAAAAAMGSDSLVVENDQGNDRPEIIDWWGYNQTAGFHQVIRLNSAMETTRDLRANVGAANPLPMLPRGERIPVAPQETLSVTVSGSNTSGDVEIGCLTLAYRGLTNRGNYINWSEKQRRGYNLQSLAFSIAAATAGHHTQAGSTWGTLLRANHDYAILGFTCSAAHAAVGFVGPDSGNACLAMPGVLSDPQWASGYFGELSRMHGDMRTIPVFNSGNLSNSFIRVTANETSPTIAGTMWIVPLR